MMMKKRPNTQNTKDKAENETKFAVRADSNPAEGLNCFMRLHQMPIPRRWLAGPFLEKS